MLKHWAIALCPYGTVASQVRGNLRKASAWWEHTLHATWQATLTTALLLGVAALGRKWPAPWRYGLLLLALFKFAFPPFLSVPSGAFSHLGPRVALSAPANPGNQFSLAARPEPERAGAASGRTGRGPGMTGPADPGAFAARTAVTRVRRCGCGREA